MKIFPNSMDHGPSLKFVGKPLTFITCLVYTLSLYLICKPTRKQNSIGELGLQNCMVIVVTPTQSTSCFWIGNCLGNGARDIYWY